MTTYKIYHQGNPLMEVIAVPNSETQLFPIYICGIEHLRLPDFELTISCPLEDVRVERDGQPVTLQVVTTFSIGPEILYNSYKIE